MITAARTGSSRGLGPATPQNDLRAFIAACEARGEVAHVNGAHWDKEMGAVTEVLYRQKIDRSPLLLFDEVPGYPLGFRCAYGMFGSPFRLGLAFGMDAALAGARRIDQLNFYRKNIKRAYTRIAPAIVDDGPVFENVVRGDDVDLTAFPVPIHHEDDGGRYIGTGTGVVTRDPETGQINVGAYRSQLIDRNTVATNISRTKHGALHRAKYFAAGQPCPVAIVVGSDPLTYMSGGFSMAESVPEFDWIGGLMGRPAELVTGEVTGLPFPARAEIVLEGWMLPDATVFEGPFGEWLGYYADDGKHQPVVRIERVYHRNDPVLTCAASQKPPHAHLYERCFLRSAALLDSLEGAGIPDVRGAWLHQAGAGRTVAVVAIKQRYFGHSTQVGIVASQLSPIGYLNRWLIVVDDDIDPTDIHDVIWAMGTRCDPKTRTTILDHCWSARIDPMVTDPTRQYNSRIVVDACIPYERLETFPRVATTSPDLAAAVRAKYPDLFA